MPLDFELIQQSIEYSKDNIKNTTDSGCPGLFFLDDFLYPTLIDKLIDFIISNDLDWQVQERQEYRNRLKINWIPDSPIEEVHTVMDQLTDSLNEKFNTNYKFIGISIWKDQEGYCIPQHIDNEVIDAAIQIYLTGEKEDLGTRFEYNNQGFQARYQKNHGYLVDGRKKLVHSMNSQVPKNHIRYSLYAVWTNLT